MRPGKAVLPVFQGGTDQDVKCCRSFDWVVLFTPTWTSCFSFKGLQTSNQPG